MVPFKQTCFRLVIQKVDSSARRLFTFLRMGSVACAIPSRLSFGQEECHSLVELAEPSAASLDTLTPTAQELLGHRVLQSLDEERRESQRFLRAFLSP